MKTNKPAKSQALKKKLFDEGMKSLRKKPSFQNTERLAKARSRAEDKLVQVSKEFHGGKWKKVGFYEDSKGRVSVKPIK